MKLTNSTLLVGLAGQQNAGKSTIFNMLTGANQHVANYPGVTVDKKAGKYTHDNVHVNVVDLPGTYSLSSYSLEERVARDFLLRDKPDLIVNVVDATTLKRSLSFTFQLLEMGFPLVVALNMVDVAKQNGITVDVELLEHRLGVTVIPTIGRKRVGRQELKDAILATAKRTEYQVLAIGYDMADESLQLLVDKLHGIGLGNDLPCRWLAVRLLEGDNEIARILQKENPAAMAIVQESKEIIHDFTEKHSLPLADYLAGCRDRLAQDIVQSCMKESKKGQISISEKIDVVVLHRFVAPFILVATVFSIYQLSIVKGYDLTHYWWPLLAKLRGIVASFLPDAGLLEDPYIRSMSLWMVDSANALLNYIPIFLILFALIAILEDSGYMARIAFILDKLFHLFGLHGQSTLPYILGGVFAGGCAVPGVMSTKGIPDEKSRMATILTVPYMNCLAKIPFYTLLINVFFVSYKSWAMLFLSTITIFFALLIARLLTLTVLRSKETAPFVMELPKYHPPTLFGVGQRAIERTWQYVKKVGTIVVAVSVCVFTLLQFPGIPSLQREQFRSEMDQAVLEFAQKTAASSYAALLHDRQQLTALVNYYNDYKADKLLTRGGKAAARLDAGYQQQNPQFFQFLNPKENKDATIISKALRNLANTSKTLKRQIKEQQIETSFLGLIGRSLEPITQWAGFNWKINVAILSSFAARESSVATIGVLYQQGADENKSLEERMGSESGSNFTPLHALAIMVFFALYPPCLAATIMIKVQTGSYKWMLFSIVFPTGLGFLVASGIFTFGSMLQLSGIQMMAAFYILIVAMTCIVAFAGHVRNRKTAQIASAVQFVNGKI